MKKLTNPSLQRPLAGKASAGKLLCGALIAVLLLLFGNAFAASTIILSEDFEGTFPQGHGWTVGDMNQLGWTAYWGKVYYDFGSPGIGTHGGYYKGYCAGVGYYNTYTNPVYHSSMSSYMYRNIDLYGYTTATVTFWVKIPGIGAGDAAGVAIDSDVVWMVTTPISDWTLITLDLTKYVGGTHRLDFELDSDSDSRTVAEGMYLDDITVTGSTGAVPPILLSPQEGKSQPRFDAGFTWRDVGSKYSWYRVYVANSANQTCLDTWVNTTNCTPTTALAAGNYSWWVVGWNSSGLGPWSAAGHFTLAQQSPGKAELDGPTAGSYLTSPRVTYSWGVGGHATWCELYVTKNGALFLDKWFPASGSSYATCDQLLRGHSSGNYNWWVRGWNADGLGPWSPAGNFSISLNAPGAINIHNPMSSVSPAAARTFTWDDDPSVDWYCIEICTNYFTPILTQWFQGTSSYTLSNALAVGGEYSWRIRGWNSAGMGPDVIYSGFTIMAPGAISYPSGGATLSPYTFCYQWYGGDTTTWYEVYINRNNSLFYHQWLPASSLQSYSDGTLSACNIPGDATGSYTWWVRCYSPVTGYSAWSKGESFTVVSF